MLVATVALNSAVVFLTRLGIPKLWNGDPETLWPYARHLVSPFVARVAPSFGYGLERVPPTGGAVVAANHLSAIDPPLLGGLSPRAIYFMAKKELLDMPFVGDVLTWTGAFPVRRGAGDRESGQVHVKPPPDRDGDGDVRQRQQGHVPADDV